jgi:hypothetical protein
MTNEFIFAYTFIGFPNVFEDPQKVDRAAVGYPYQGLFKNGVAQIPAFTAWGGEMATLLNPGGFEVGGDRGLFADKHLPSLQNNLTKVWGTHTVKGGFYWEHIINTQPASPFTNGLAVFSNAAASSNGSIMATYSPAVRTRMKNRASRALTISGIPPPSSLYKTHGRQLVG